MRSSGDIKGLKVLKSKAGALLSSCAKRGQLGRTDVVDGGGVRAIFTRMMLQQLWERTPEPWCLITADRRVQLTSSGSIPGRCWRYCWSASRVLFVGGAQLVGTNIRGMTPPTTQNHQNVFKCISESTKTSEIRARRDAALRLRLCLSAPD